MFVRISKTRDGVEYVHIVEAYRDEKGKSRQRIVERCGRLAELTVKDPDALVKLKEHAKQLTLDRQSARGSIEYDTAAPSSGVLPSNVGWLLVQAVMDRLGAATVLRDAAKAGGWQIDVAKILEVLVAARVTWPCSKKASAERAGQLLLGGGVLDVGHVYQGLDRIGAMSLELQRAASTGLGRTPESLATVDYDVTNYFFHIDRADTDTLGKQAPRGKAKRKLGVSKEHRLDPIIQMGLFCDSHGIPVCFRLFDGNIPDMSTLPEAVAEFKAAFTPGRIVVVGDKAMNTRPNLGVLFQHADGWIVSESSRKADTQLRGWLLNPTGWTWNPDHTLGHKSQLVERAVPVEAYGVPGVMKKTTEKIIATWSAARAHRDRATRDDIITQAEKLTTDEARYRAGTKRGPRRYITAETIDPATGEITTRKQALLRLNQTKIDADAELDGFHLIRTTETTIPDPQIIARYHQLVQIEDAFRITKTDLEARPVYVSTPLHIEAHFTICFLALLVTRLLQQWTGLPTGQLINAIRHLETIDCGHGIHRISRPPAWNQIDTATGYPLNQDWATLTQLRQWQRDLTTATKTTTYTTRSTP